MCARISTLMQSFHRLVGIMIMITRRRASSTRQDVQRESLGQLSYPVSEM